MWILYTLIGLAGFAVLLFLVAGYVAYLFSLTRREKKPSLQEPDAKAKIRIDANIAGGEYLLSKNPEDVFMKARDGLVLKGYFLPAEKPSDKLAVLVHGYTATGPGEFGGFIRFYHEELGYNILLPDHRAHGRSGGKRIGFAALEWQDILDWTDIYAKRLGPDTEVVLHGISMGGATVMQCNANNPPAYVKCIVEDCGYTNGYEMMWLAARRDLHLNIPPIMWACAMWFRLFTGKSLRRDSDPYGNIDRFARPTLFVHGAEDPFVPTEMGERCYAAATVEKDLLLVPGAAHAMAYYIGKEEYEAKMKEWYAKWMGERVTV